MAAFAGRTCEQHAFDPPWQNVAGIYRMGEHRWSKSDTLLASPDDMDIPVCVPTGEEAIAIIRAYQESGKQTEI